MQQLVKRIRGSWTFRAVGRAVVWTLELTATLARALAALARSFFGLAAAIPAGADVSDLSLEDVPAAPPPRRRTVTLPPPIPVEARKSGPVPAVDAEA